MDICRQYGFLRCLTYYAQNILSLVTNLQQAVYDAHSLLYLATQT